MGKIAEDEKVDFVILWVDGNDPEWQASKAKYTADKGQELKVLVSRSGKIRTVGQQRLFCNLWSLSGVAELRASEAAFCQA